MKLYEIIVNPFITSNHPEKKSAEKFLKDNRNFITTEKKVGDLHRMMIVLNKVHGEEIFNVTEVRN